MNVLLTASMSAKLCDFGMCFSPSPTPILCICLPSSSELSQRHNNRARGFTQLGRACTSEVAFYECY
jgi:hypothetical protein